VDAVLLGSVIKNCGFVVKDSLLANSCFGRCIRAAGYVTNDTASGFLSQCSRLLEEGCTLVIFPEGTRSPHQGLGRFSRGAARLSLRTGVPVVPAVIRCDPPTLKKHQRWSDVPEKRIRFEVTFHAARCCTTDGNGAVSDSRLARQFTEELEAFFNNELRTKDCTA
jgi:1-acyl-sn-glycerol-3-phosphate acyltransferase